MYKNSFNQGGSLLGFFKTEEYLWSIILETRYFWDYIVYKLGFLKHLNFGEHSNPTTLYNDSNF